MNRITASLLVCVHGCWTLGCGGGVVIPPVDPSFQTAHPAIKMVEDAIVTSVDEVRGVPRFLRATARQRAPEGATGESAALHHLAHHARTYALGERDLQTVEVASVHDRGAGGVLVSLLQRVHGYPVMGSRVRVLMRPNLELVAMAGSPAAADEAPPWYLLTEQQALNMALLDHLAGGFGIPEMTETQPGSDGSVRLVPARDPGEGQVRFVRPARVQRVLHPRGSRLLAAYQVEFVIRTPRSMKPDAYRYLVSAVDGELLLKHSLVNHVAFNYRVWAESTGDKRPLDSPLADRTPYVEDGDATSADCVPPNLVSMEGFNTNPDGEADPWLDEHATETRGNNVDVFADLTAPDGFSAGDVRASITGPLAFDYNYNTHVEPLASAEQTSAAVTQLFYVINWLHDWFYDSGFDEAAGNAQVNNFGRGGVEGDPILAHAQDVESSPAGNNAAIITPGDGESPIMWVYLWDGPAYQTLTVTPPGQDWKSGTAAFGPTNYNVTGPVVLAGKGCDPLDGNVTGRVVVVDRGDCPFKQKAVNAQSAGAIALLVVNNQEGPPPAMGDGGPDVTVTLPVQSISQRNGVALKASLQTQDVTAHLVRVAEPRRDGALDTTIIAHEWGHYLHRRLTEGYSPATMAMGEGWGDFIALQTMVREGDDLHGTYALATYATEAGERTGYFGLRRAPYSVDFTRNAFTFRHIADGEPLPEMPMQPSPGPNSEVHNAGEVWAAMLFESYVALLDQRTTLDPPLSFAQAQRLMSDLTVAGLSLTPANATFTEARDAVLAAAAARDPELVEVLAAAFARRGAGSCAVSPPRYSSRFKGVVESMELAPVTVVGSVQWAEDGTVDDEGKRTVVVEVGNAGGRVLEGAVVTVEGMHGIATGVLPSIAPFDKGTVVIPVEVDANGRGEEVSLRVSVMHEWACKTVVTRDVSLRITRGDSRIHPETGGSE